VVEEDPSSTERLEVAVKPIDVPSEEHIGSCADVCVWHRRIVTITMASLVVSRGEGRRTRKEAHGEGHRQQESGTAEEILVLPGAGRHELGQSAAHLVHAQLGREQHFDLCALSGLVGAMPPGERDETYRGGGHL